jgi:hypothetical protein
MCHEKRMDADTRKTKKNVEWKPEWFRSSPPYYLHGIFDHISLRIPFVLIQDGRSAWDLASSGTKTMNILCFQHS